jgi:YbbR domain-containing protein
MLHFLTDTLGWRFLLSLVLAVTFWARLTLEQNPERRDLYPTEIQVEARDLPAGLVVANEIPPVKLRLAAPQENWRFLEPSSFRAVVDLSNAQPGLVQTDIIVESVDPEVRILERTPQKVSLRIEELRTKVIPVQVTQVGSVPFGFKVGEPSVSPPVVEVSGPSSIVEKANVAAVTVRLDDARSTVDRSLKPEPRGPAGVVAGVRIEPQTVTLTVPVEQIAGSKTVSVVPQVRGQPAPGYWQGPISVDPATVQIVADPSLLDTVTVLNTADVDISGAEGEVTRTVPISRPQGISLVRDQAATVRVSVLPLQGQQVRDLPIVAENLGEGLSIAVTPRSVSGSISGAQPVLLRMGPEGVIAVVNLAGREPGEHTVPVQLRIPDGVRVDRILPEQVTVTITRVPPEA